MDRSLKKKFNNEKNQREREFEEADDFLTMNYYPDENII